MARTKRSAVRSERAAERDECDHDSAAATMSPKTYTIPQRSSSRAPSIAGVNGVGSDNTLHDEDTSMQQEEHLVNGEETMQSFGQRSWQLINFIKKLEGLGIDAALPSLPKFVVVGDQSHGKSSIIEAICGISMPRSDGTCTRVPFRITTTASRPGESFSCKVSLTRCHVPDRNGKWQDTHAGPVDFATVTNRADLEEVLRLAQIGILNPQADPKSILRYGAPDSDASSLEFSKNPVNLEISGPELPELSFIDLPGCVSFLSGGSDQRLIKVIRQLVKSYIDDDKALILLVASAGQDMETSTAVGLVNECRALGRCMGVLTKPDLCGSGRSDVIGRILRNEFLPVGLSWYVTKNLSQEQLHAGVDHAEARQLEAAFFQEGMWTNELAGHAPQFGTGTVQSAISTLLVQHIEKEIPGISQRVEARLQYVENQLADMPGAPEQPTLVVFREAQKLAGLVGGCIDNDNKAGNLRSKMNKMICAFKQRLADTRPTAKLGTPGYKTPSIPVDDDDENESEIETPTKKRKAVNGHALPNTPTNSSRRPKREQDSPAAQPKIVYTLDMFKEARECGSNVRESCNPKIIESSFVEAIKPWKSLTKALMGEVKKEVEDMLVECIVTVMGSRGETQLLQETQEIVGSLCQTVYEDQEASIERLLAFDLCGPLTYNDKLLEQTNVSTTRAKEIRNLHRINEHYDTLVANGAKKSIPDANMRKEKAKDTAWVEKEIGLDEYAVDVTVIASISAYYTLISARLVDIVAMHVQHGFAGQIKAQLEDKLLEQLNWEDRAWCEQLLAQDPVQATKRQSFITERKNLQQAQEELVRLPGQY